MDAADIAAIILPPLITGVLAVLAVLFRSWWQERDHDRRARDGLLWATDQVRYISTWLELQERLSQLETVPSQLLADIGVADQRAREGMKFPKAEVRRTPVRDALRKLLLLRRPTSSAALWWQVVYYGTLVWAGYVSIVGVRVAMDDRDEPGESLVISIISTGFAVLIVGGSACIGAWYIAVHYQREGLRRRTAPAAV